MTTDGQFVSNELLLHLKNINGVNTNGTIIEEGLECDANGNEELSMEVSSEVEQRSTNLQWNDLDIIHMLNNGNIIAVDRSALNTVTISAGLTAEETESTFSKLYEEVSALKCNLCGFLCEEQQQIIEHLKSEHISRV